MLETSTYTSAEAHIVVHVTYNLLCSFTLFIFFFFSSRRRHTRFDCDWSSDVCSSDLGMCASEGAVSSGIVLHHVRKSALAPSSSRPRPSSPNSCIISHVLTSCQSCVE